MDTIITYEYPPADDDLIIKTIGDHKFRIAKPLYMKFGALVKIIENNPSYINDNIVLSLPYIGYKPMYCLIDLAKILAYDGYTEQLTKKEVLDVYFEYMWTKTIKGLKLSVYTMVVDAARLFKVEELREPFTRFFLKQLFASDTVEECNECLVRIGYPWADGFLCEITNAVKEVSEKLDS